MVMPSIRSGSPRVFGWITDTCTLSAAEARLRDIQDRTTPLIDRAGEVDPLVITPMARRDQRYDFMNPHLALFRAQRIVQFKARLSHEDWEYCLLISSLASPGPFQGTVGDKLAFSVQSPGI